MPYSEAHKRATFKYRKEHTKRLVLDLPIAEHEAIEAHCKALGIPKATFIRQLAKDAIKPVE